MNGSSRIAGLLSILYPPTCVLCGAPGARGWDLCAGCESDLPRNLDACPRCAFPFDAPAPPGTLCGRCQRREPPFDGAIAAFRYEAAVPALIVGAKFQRRLNVARLLGQCLASALIERGLDPPDRLIPVPLHPARQRERGYNQALEIARSVDRELSIPIDAGLCSRVAATPPQAGLDERARRRNIRGAFVVHRPLQGKHLAILDDVVTTGSTVAELSRGLRRAGAARIEVWSVARTP